MLFRRFLRPLAQKCIRYMETASKNKTNEQSIAAEKNIQGITNLITLLSGTIGVPSALYYMGNILSSVTDLKVQMTKLDQRINDETNALKVQMTKLEEKINKETNVLIQRNDVMSQRMDFIYNALLEESRQHHKEMKESEKRFYELLTKLDKK